MIINRIQVLNYGCLRYVDVPMGRFHVLIGPNASGKSTLMDAIKFVSDVVREGVDAAYQTRTSNFADLVWGRPLNPENQWFEIALEFELPEDVRRLMPEERPFNTFRYELSIGTERESNSVGLRVERATLLVRHPYVRRSVKTSLEYLFEPRQLEFFPQPLPARPSVIQRSQSGRTVFSKSADGRTRYYYETDVRGGRGGWVLGLNLGPKRSVWSILPDYDENYPAATRILAYLRDRVMNLSLNSEQMRQASRPGAGSDFLPDGSNIPWVADNLINQSPELAKDWMGHIQCSLQGFDSVRVIDREDDRHKYLMLKYSNGLEVPSWKASDGTLRLMALTMLAYLPGSNGLYMVEEPENGIHPGALQAIFDSLSSVYDAQVLLATHSPEFLAICDVENLLCFGKNEEGIVDIVPGPLHPHLQEWRNETDLGTFFATGILA